MEKVGAVCSERKECRQKADAPGWRICVWCLSHDGNLVLLK